MYGLLRSLRDQLGREGPSYTGIDLLDNFFVEIVERVRHSIREDSTFRVEVFCDVTSISYAILYTKE